MADQDHIYSAVVAAEGHLVDSQQLKAIFDKVIERGATFEVQHFDWDGPTTSSRSSR